jgi:hypothetical protein
MPRAFFNRFSVLVIAAEGFLLVYNSKLKLSFQEAVIRQQPDLAAIRGGMGKKAMANPTRLPSSNGDDGVVHGCNRN